MDNNEFLDVIHSRLLKIRDALIKVNQASGATQRVTEMQNEIERLGWKGVLDKYHPDVNVGDPAAHELFSMYKYVYKNMCKEKSSDTLEDAV